ncbi:ATP-binding protein [Streptomyces marokkonensis]|uniref:ATP-binding protein n=1 Tax=Streptomyces marokkonensis TaxID=324855 RepID=A0ABW6QGJ2_9ACTN
MRVATDSAARQPPLRGEWADAQRNRQTVITAAAEVFVTSGADALIRQIAARAGLGTATTYRHFPTRADPIATVYRHQIEACAEAGPNLLALADSPLGALRQQIDLFVDFLVTEHGLAEALQFYDDRFAALHTCFSCGHGSEKISVAIASDESFGGWTRTLTDPQLCAAIADRLTFGGNVIEIGSDSYRLAGTRARAAAQVADTG